MERQEFAPGHHWPIGSDVTTIVTGRCGQSSAFAKRRNAGNAAAVAPRRRKFRRVRFIVMPASLSTSQSAGRRRG